MGSLRSIKKKRAASVLLALTFFIQAMLWSGCFSQNLLEGYFVESAESGRWMVNEAVEGAPIRFLRLKIVQFDEDVAGIVEIFDVADHERLTLQSSTPEEGAGSFFCTRLDPGATSKDGRLVMRFRDESSRQWEISARLDDEDQMRGELHRVNSRGEVLPNPSQEEASLALAAGGLDGQVWRGDWQFFGSEQGEQEQLVLDRELEEVDSQLLSCSHHNVQRRLLRLSIPANIPAKAKIALILSRPERGLSGEEITSMSFEEIASITLDDLDILDGERAVLLRSAPPSIFTLSGMAVGTFILYEDLPSPEGGDYNGRWDNLQPGALLNEPVLGYVRQRVLIYHDKEGSVLVSPRSVSGDLLGVCEVLGDVGCLYEESTEMGWALYSYSADEVSLGGGLKALSLKKLRGDALDAATLEPIPAKCQGCYPSPREEQGCASDCPILFPMLNL